MIYEATGLDSDLRYVVQQNLARYKESLQAYLFCPVSRRLYRLGVPLGLEAKEMGDERPQLRAL